MAKKKLTSSSPMYGDIDLVSFQVMINGSELEDKFVVESIVVQKALNKIATAEIVILDGDPSEQDFELLSGNNARKLKPGTEIRINAGYHQNNETIFEGIIVKTGLRIKEKLHSAVVVECADKAIKMTLLRKNEYFLKTQDNQVIQQIVGNHGLSVSVDSTSYQHKEIIQYNSTDWDFVLTRAELNGLVVLTDDNKVKVEKPKVSGATELSLTYGIDVIKTNLAVDSKEQLKAVECSSWDFNQQRIVDSKSSEPSVNDQGSNAPFKGKDLADVISSDDYRLHVTGPIESAALKNWANARLLKSRLARIRGSVTFQGNSGIKPNQLIEINGLGDYFNGSAFVSRVYHELLEGNWITEVEVGLSPDWFVETKPDIMTPSAGGLLPGIDGLYNATVKKIHADPDGDMRIQVDIPVIDPSGDGVWARLANLHATKNAGSFWIPEVGDEVVLGFLNNDPCFPVILGSLYGKNKAPYTPDQQNSIKAFVTKNKLKLIFEDKDKNIILETPGGNIVTISDQDKSITLVDSNRNKIEMNNKGITLDTMKDVKISAKGKINMEAMQGVQIKATAGDVKAEGLNVQAKANINASIQGTMAELKGTATTTIKGGIVMIN